MPDKDKPVTQVQFSQALSGLLGDVKTLLEAQESRMQASMEALEGRINARLQGQEERLREGIRDAQTQLLRAFHPWASSADIKFRSTAVSLAALDERLLSVEERLGQIERGRLQ